MPRERLLPAIHPNRGIELAYRHRLEALVEEMHHSLLYWVQAAYRQNEPAVARLAQDENAALVLRLAVRRLARRWQRRFNELASELAEHFARSAVQRSDAALRSALKRAGIAVRFRMGPAASEILQATVHENVGLIRSIGQQHLGQVEQLVMRSVQTGRDLKDLTEGLQTQFHSTRRRAQLIARDQNNKATAAIQRARQLELGIQEAVWIHSGGGKTPRRTHVRAGRDRVRYRIAEGWYDPDEKKHVLPGQLINCRCVARPVLPAAA